MPGPETSSIRVRSRESVMFSGRVGSDEGVVRHRTAAPGTGFAPPTRHSLVRRCRHSRECSVPSSPDCEGIM